MSCDTLVFMSVVEPGYRKTIRHFDLFGHCHELTFSCLDRRPLLDDDRWRTLLAGAITAACERHRFSLIGYVFMPEHVHLLIISGEREYSTSSLLYAIKRPVSFRIKQTLESSGQPADRALLGSLIVRERPGKNSFRFWQEGPGYDRNLVGPAPILDSLRYVHDNPVRRGLVRNPGDWPWSSWRHYHEPTSAMQNPVVDVQVVRLQMLPAPR